MAAFSSPDIISPVLVNRQRTTNCHLIDPRTMIRLIEGQRLEKRLSNHDQKLEIQLKGWKLDQAKSAKLLGLKLDKQLSSMFTLTVSVRSYQSVVAY